MPGPVRVYTDEHIAMAIVRGLRKLGVDVLTFRQAGMMSASDEKHLDRAHALGRAVLTRDKDFLRVHSARSTPASFSFRVADQSGRSLMAHSWFTRY
jgi:predicted nuclease of predicted toxin-antitoxin system